MTAYPQEAQFHPPERQTRIIGYDFARALAILGMFIINFKSAMEAETNGAFWLQRLLELLEGRAAATFVILAGVGLSLLSQKARLEKDAAKLMQHRHTLWKRAIFLFLVGLAYTPVWPPDILRFYGLYIAISACLLTVSDRALWRIALGSMTAFVLLLFLFDYDAGWDWASLEYLDFWTSRGMLRHLFFNGYHPVFPWLSFLLAGMWLGRQDLTDTAFRKKMFAVCTAVVLVTESVSWMLTVAVKGTVSEADMQDALALVDSAIIPPMPFYLFSAGSVAIIVILLSIMVTQRYADSRWVRALVSTGQMALTLYIAHVIVGMGLLEGLGRFEHQSLTFAVLVSILFYGAGVTFAVFWHKHFTRGPLESILRRVT